MLYLLQYLIIDCKGKCNSLHFQMGPQQRASGAVLEIPKHILAFQFYYKRKAEPLPCLSYSFVTVMTFERNHVDNYLVIFNAVNHPVAFVYFSTP